VEHCTVSSQVNGFGLGLRVEHYRDFLDHPPRVDWLEVTSENFMAPGGKPLFHLDAIRANYPMVMHGVSLSIGSCDPLDRQYLGDLKALIARIEPAWVSDHLCWTGVDHTNLHDLLPMPYTEEALQHLCRRVDQVQNYLGRPLVLENVSSYVQFKVDEMSEWEFVATLLKRSGCQLLLDVNNIYVSSVNHQFNAKRYIDAMPAAQIRQIHLAGHEDHGDYIIDTHDHDVSEPVWALYEYAIQRFGLLPTMIERDDHIPPLAALLDELDVARRRAAQALEGTRHARAA
jgi:uncharacterized protein (UPF0276 family)